MLDLVILCDVIQHLMFWELQYAVRKAYWTSALPLVHVPAYCTAGISQMKLNSPEKLACVSLLVDLTTTKPWKHLRGESVFLFLML